MKILITGGAGFIGSNLVRTWRCSRDLKASTPIDDELIVFDCLTYAGQTRNLDGLGATFVYGNITDARAVDKAFSDYRPDAVIHMAAESHVDKSLEDGATFARTNVVGTQILLDAARKYGVKRFIFVSTDEVYGSLTIGDAPRKETDPLHPSSPYAASKAAADLLVLAHHRTYGLPVIITRSTNNYGPRQHPEKLIPQAILRALEKKKIPLYGNGTNVRDWIHVSDHCKALETVLDHGVPGEIYNIGAGKGVSNLVVAEAILSHTGDIQGRIEFISDRPGHDFRYAVNTTKISALGWKPTVSLRAGLSETVIWYRENVSWWLPIVNADRYKQWVEKNYTNRRGS